MINNPLILHNQENVQDIMLHTGIVRYLYEINEGNIIYIVKQSFHNLLKNHYGDLDITYEIVTDLTPQSIFKLVMNKYKNHKNRMFFGEYDKYRLDSFKNNFKNNFNSENYNPYLIYNFDPSIKYSYFKTECINKDCMKLVNLIRSVANMDYRIFSKGDLIPKQYKKNSTIAVHIDKIFKTDNFFDSIVLIEKTQYLHITDHITDDFSTYVYYLYKSKNYPNIFDKKHIYLFYQNDEPNYVDLPQYWNLIKINNLD